MPSTVLIHPSYGRNNSRISSFPSSSHIIEERRRLWLFFFCFLLFECTIPHSIHQSTFPPNSLSNLETSPQKTHSTHCKIQKIHFQAHSHCQRTYERIILLRYFYGFFLCVCVFKINHITVGGQSAVLRYIYLFSLRLLSFVFFSYSVLING